jgi:ubiquitin-protein ligase
MSSLKRIQKEYQKILKNPLDGISVAPVSESDMNIWKGIIDGPDDSPYKGGKFVVNIKFPDSYPMNPPEIVFETLVYHPNISEDYICLDILQDKWTPALTIDKVLLSLSSLLTDPNPDDPLCGTVADEYVNDNKKYLKNAKKWTKKYAM